MDDPDTANAVAKPTETRCFSGGNSLVIIRIPWMAFLLASLLIWGLGIHLKKRRRQLTDGIIIPVDTPISAAMTALTANF